MKNRYALLLGGAVLLASYYAPVAIIGQRLSLAGGVPADSAFTISIAPQPPRDLPPGSDPKQLAEFAWGEFFALNWQSAYTPQNLRRDEPNLKWNFAQPDASLAVWETFAHRTELRPYRGPLKPFDSQPSYSYGKTILPYPGPEGNGPLPSFNLFNNLDENNEIGSCNVYGQVSNSTGGKQMVLYQAKVNRDEYEYIARNPHFNTNDSLLASVARTQNNIASYDAYYNPAAPANRRYRGTCDCPPDVVCLPCGNAAPGGRTGTIEVKTAWRQLDQNEDASRFFTRNVIYYKQVVVPVKIGNRVVTSDTLLTYTNGKFALIGFHIIHKTTNYPAFVFATWEQIDVEKQNMALQLLNPQGQPYGKLHAYQRLHPISTVAEQATAAAHRQLRRLNPKSVWLNYRLVGVQGTPTSDSTALNFFLANYVVESDSTLADFHGRSIGHPHDFGSNVLYRGKRLAVGGCQGCHGVAQQGGTDFSFLLDSFQKPVVAPDVDQTQRAKLARYIQSTARR